MDDMSPWTRWGFALVVVTVSASVYWFSGPGNADEAEVIGVRATGTTLDVVLGVCNPTQLRVEATESESQVRLRTTFADHAKGDDCAATTSVTLRSPLAGRTVVDYATGEAVRVDE